MVGQLDPDIPLTNVQVSVTRIMLDGAFFDFAYLCSMM